MLREILEEVEINEAKKIGCINNTNDMNEINVAVVFEAGTLNVVGVFGAEQAGRSKYVKNGTLTDKSLYFLKDNYKEIKTNGETIMNGGKTFTKKDFSKMCKESNAFLKKWNGVLGMDNVSISDNILDVFYEKKFDKITPNK